MKNTFLVFSLLGASGSPFLRSEPSPRPHRGIFFLRSHAEVAPSGVALGREALALARSGAEAQAVAALAEAFQSGEAPEIGVKCGKCRHPPHSPTPTLTHSHLVSHHSRQSTRCSRHWVMRATSTLRWLRTTRCGSNAGWYLPWSRSVP